MFLPNEEKKTKILNGMVYCKCGSEFSISVLKNLCRGFDTNPKSTSGDSGFVPVSKCSENRCPSCNEIFGE